MLTLSKWYILFSSHTNELVWLASWVVLYLVTLETFYL